MTCFRLRSARSRKLRAGSSPPATSTTTSTWGSSSTSDGSVVNSPLGTATARDFETSRTRMRWRRRSTPARRRSTSRRSSRRPATWAPTVPSPISPMRSAPSAMSPILTGMALLLREADVERLADMASVMDALEAAMRDLGEGSAENQPRRRVFPPGGVLNVMFASWPEGGVSGLKTYTVAAGRARFLVVLYDLEGCPLALIEADHMGAVRTGAATGVTARRLAPAGPKTVAVIGTGRQARTQALALKTGLEIAELRVFGRDPERRARFAAAVGAI